jgi:phage shock protein C
MTEKRRGELLRDPSKGKIAGVCAGIADYFGWETWLVRILAVSGVLLGMGWFVVVYIAAWFILEKKLKADGTAPSKASAKGRQSTAYSKNDDVSDESIKVKSRIWQSGEPPKQAFHDIRRKFRRLERKLQSIEKYVTSSEFTVAREINKL